MAQLDRKGFVKFEQRPTKGTYISRASNVQPSGPPQYVANTPESAILSSLAERHARSGMLEGGQRPSRALPPVDNLVVESESLVQES